MKMRSKSGVRLEELLKAPIALVNRKCKITICDTGGERVAAAYTTILAIERGTDTEGATFSIFTAYKNFAINNRPFPRADFWDFAGEKNYLHLEDFEIL